MAVAAKKKTITSAAPKGLLAGTIPTKKLTKEQLFKTHEGHIKKQNAAQAPNGPRAVKQPNLAEAYPASTKSIRDLEIVCRCTQARSGSFNDIRLTPSPDPIK